jgi:hypothetical protein
MEGWMNRGKVGGQMRGAGRLIASAIVSIIKIIL